MAHPTTNTADVDRPVFAAAVRGYDRRQVDARMRELTSEAAKLQHALSQSDQRAAQAEDELRSALTKLKQAGQKGDPAKEQEGFGYRVEKVLRMAEIEASDIRNKAAREASALVEKARADAETHRHEVEQSLISRASEMDQEAARRQVELQEREQQIADQLGSARKEADQLLAQAQRDAAQLRQDAESTAAELRQRAEKTARQHREAAEHELRRLTSMHTGVRAELARLHKLLTSELNIAETSDDAPKHGKDESGPPAQRSTPPNQGQGAVSQTQGS